MDKKILIELFLDETDQDNSLDMVSFVSAPANESGFMYFSDDKEKFKFEVTDTEKRIVTGAAMIPNQEIIRLDAEGKPYFVFFTEETVEKAQEVFAKYGKTKSSNVEHAIGVRDVTVIESWIVTDPTNDKSNALGFKNIPKGTWFISYKVDNDDLWSAVKSGEVLGFSIEGVFSKKPIQLNKEVDEIDFDDVIETLNNEGMSYDEIYENIAKIASKLKNNRTNK